MTRASDAVIEVVVDWSTELPLAQVIGFGG
jgi:hypothetical protein